MQVCFVRLKITCFFSVSSFCPYFLFIFLVLVFVQQSWPNTFFYSPLDSQYCPCIFDHWTDTQVKEKEERNTCFFPFFVNVYVCVCLCVHSTGHAVTVMWSACLIQSTEGERKKKTKGKKSLSFILSGPVCHLNLPFVLSAVLLCPSHFLLQEVE